MSLEKNIERIADALEQIASNTVPAAAVITEGTLEDLGESLAKDKTSKKKKSKPEPTAYSIDDVRSTANGLINKAKDPKKAVEKAKKVIKKFKAEKIIDLKQEQFCEVIEALKEEFDNE